MNDPAARLDVLVLGAGYGSLLAIKLLMAGHGVTLCCTQAEGRQLERRGLRVRFPLSRSPGEILVDSRALSAPLDAATPESIDPEPFDLVVLAMQEPHYSAPELRALLVRIGAAARPVLSIMNMPPPGYLQRLPVIDVEACVSCYRDADLWRALPAERLTHASADAQASRRDDGDIDVGLPSNLWIAPFAEPSHNSILERLAADINAVRATVDGERLRVPVRLGLSDSVARPLAKLPMLLAGNYRCVETDRARSIAEAVIGDAAEARDVYNWVASLCRELGAGERDLVSFDQYTEAASTLRRPSSVARALFAGACWVERTDRLVQTLGLKRGRRSPILDACVARVDERLASNRKHANAFAVRASQSSSR